MSYPQYSFRLSLAVLLVGMVACGDDGPSSTDVDALGGLDGAVHDGAVPDAAPDAEVDAPPEAVCAAYPVPVPVGGSTEAAALADLATLSGTGQLTWSAQRGTLSTIFQLGVTLPACVDGADANAVVRDVLAAHPTLFQLDFSEWHLPEPFNCQFVGAFDTITMGRTLLGGHPVARDIFAYTLRREGDVVSLASTIATYLPPVSSEVADAMASCDHLDAAQATATVQARTLSATIFDQCAPTGTLEYQPDDDDTYELRDDKAWLWDETESGVFLTGTQTLRVTLDHSNYTPELNSSDARCPVLDGPGDEFTIGFDVMFDIETGEVINVKPGLDCIVC
jgi:hypothetical protein